jgi:hypothetical protein
MGVYDYREQLLTTGQADINLLLLKDLLKLSGGDSNILTIPQSLHYLRQALDMLGRSPTAKKILLQCAKARLLINPDTLLSTGETLFHPDDNVLDVPALQGVRGAERHKLMLAEMTVALITGLREASHYHRGQAFHPELCVPDYLHLARSADADRAAFVILVCDELREAGNPLPWRHLLAGDTGDIAEVFEETMLRHDNTEIALRAAYRHWFDSGDREAASEHKALENLDRLLMHLRSSGAMSDWIGQADLAAPTWVRLGELPAGGNYLDRRRNALMRHGYRAQPSDLFNRAHFKQIMRELFA